ncbi:MAG: helix-turn-helix transcriptional regulator [Allgaiera sp.]|jgi:DNA-binding transcriptional regulator YdaS (Cro superfamily)|nr:helix-turn-helix transcriptional regulator [Allgaiera sp.]
MEKLTEYLDGHSMTQRSFAKILGVRESTVSDWMSGKLRPSAQNMLRIETKTGGNVTMRAWFDLGSAE